MRKYHMASSRLKHRLSLQQEVLSSDGMGGYVKTWEVLAELWAEIRPLGGLEVFFSGQLNARATHKIRLRYRSGVTSAMRLVFGERVFNIRSVHNIDEKNDMLELLVEEGVAT
jgi:SPP1 family predicted phage head-tail adaptor